MTAPDTVETREAKERLRRQMKALRSSMPDADRRRADAEIRKKLCQLPEYASADIVFTYLSFGGEVDTRGIIEDAWAQGKVVALPRCVGEREMRWFSVESFDGLQVSSFGVEEPPVREEYEVDARGTALSVALVPGLALDAHGYRLGYGGGFYDAFLAGFAGTSIGLCRKLQLVDSLVALGAIGAFDLPVSISVVG